MVLAKVQIVKQFHEIGFAQKKSAEIVESLLEIIKTSLESGEDVLVSGFGKFSVKDKMAGRGRNPVNGDDMKIEARKVATFECSGRLREKINRG